MEKKSWLLSVHRYYSTVILLKIRNFRVVKSGTSGFRKSELLGFTLPFGQDLILENLSEINVSSNFLDIHKNFGTNISMEISQNFGGEYFYRLNPELSGYKLGTSGFTAVPG